VSDRRESAYDDLPVPEQTAARCSGSDRRQSGDERSAATAPFLVVSISRPARQTRFCKRTKINTVCAGFADSPKTDGVNKAFSEEFCRRRSSSFPWTKNGALYLFRISRLDAIPRFSWHRRPQLKIIPCGEQDQPGHGIHMTQHTRIPRAALNEGKLAPTIAPRCWSTERLRRPMRINKLVCRNVCQSGPGERLKTEMPSHGPPYQLKRERGESHGLSSRAIGGLRRRSVGADPGACRSGHVIKRARSWSYMAVRDGVPAPAWRGGSTRRRDLRCRWR